MATASGRREAATREVLDLISRSRDDPGPVFDAVLTRAARLCEATMAALLLVTGDGTRIAYAHKWGEDRSSFRIGDGWPLDGPLMVSTAIREVRSVAAADLADDPLYRDGHPDRLRMVDGEGIRSYLVVPLVLGGKGIGVINLGRHAVRAFTPEEIALVETFAAQAVIAIENARQFRERQTALVRQTASAEILRVISLSPGETKPVFDAIVTAAVSLLGTDMAFVMIGGADTYAPVVGATPAGLIGALGPQVVPIDPALNFPSRALTSRTTLHLPDWTAIDLPDHERRIHETHGVNASLYVPMLRGDEVFGLLAFVRKERRAFTDDEIALAHSFRDQAVIAIENARLFRELQERLAQQAASAEILGVISESRDDDAPVFDVIVRNAQVLCAAPQAALILAQAGDAVQTLVAHRNLSDPTVEMFRSGRMRLDGALSYAARSILEAEVINLADMRDSDLYRAGSPVVRAMVDDVGIRSVLFLPLMSGDRAIGTFALFRYEVAPFDDRHVALVRTFAAQAVIAIENVRQFRELQTRLAREAATREILEVISQSRDDDRPVFDAVLRNANRLCGTSMATLMLGRPDDRHMTLAAYTNPLVESQDALDRIIAYCNQTMMRMDASEHFSARAILTGDVVQIADLTKTQGYLSGEPTVRILIEDMGVRTILSVPLFDAQGAIGAISLHRREMQPFLDDEIALIRGFAAQAAIAIENVRQFRAIQAANAELQTRLEREAATGEILGVIARSRDDFAPVFAAILRNAAQLCSAQLAGLNIANEAGSHLQLVAHWGPPLRSFVAGETLWPLDSDLSLAVAARERRAVQVADLKDSDLYRNGDPIRVQAVDEEGIRTFLAVPLVGGPAVIGCIGLYRREVRPFTPDEIALVETFAAQAVIAIENVRQFRELRTRLERERASAEILEVISHSRDDDRPVFDAILQSATRLCGADSAALLLGTPDGPYLTLAALKESNGLTAEDLDRFIAGINRDPMPMDPDLHISARAICSGGVVHIADLAATDGYRTGEPSFRFMVEDQGVRTTLSVPLIGAGGAVGAISVHRRDVRPYAQDEIALVQSFAAQAVIAIENVRQFRALEALNAELGDRVQEQVGEIERMGRLKRFLPAAVADAVVTSGSERMLASHRALIGVLFCDIRGFTAFCETAEPEETIEVLQTYHEEMGRLIAAHGAGVDHRMGDGIMVLFNDPLPCEDPAGQAVRLAVAMRGRMAELCAKWRRMGHRLGFGVGISLGYATVGMVGSGGRQDYTASGTAVNLAARLCDEAADGEILLSPRARTAVEGGWALESRGEKTLKGIREPVEMFAVAGPAA